MIFDSDAAEKARARRSRPRARTRPAAAGGGGGGSGQNQFTKRIKVAHPMERVLEGGTREEDGRKRRLQQLLMQFESLPQEQRTGTREKDLLDRWG